MDVEVFGVTHQRIQAWSTETPLEDLVVHDEWRFHNKLFKLDGSIVSGESLLTRDLRSHQRLQVFLVPRGPLFTPVGLILLGLTAVTGVIRLFFNQRRNNAQRANDTTDRSPVNSYEGRANISRPQARVPDIYGVHRIYPDLVKPMIFAYNGRSQVIYLLMCIGVGEYDINEIRLGDTPLALLQGVTVRVTQPGEGDADTFFPAVYRDVDNLQRLELPDNEQWGDYFTLRGDAIRTILFDFELPLGLNRRFNDRTDIGAASVLVEIQVQAVDFSYNQTFQWGISSDTELQHIFTIDSKDYLDFIPPNEYRVRVRNLTDTTRNNDPNEIYSDTVVWLRVSGGEFTETNQYSDFTMAEVRIQTGALQQEQLSNRINFLVTRRLPTWTGNSLSAFNRPTNSLADAIMDVLTGRDGGRYSLDQVDAAGLYAIQAQLTAIGEGTFNAVLDQRQSVDEELATICNLGRIRPFRYGNRIYFTRDEVKALPSGFFNGRNKIEPETISFNFPQSDDPDSVEVTWIDPELDYRPNQYLYPPDADSINVKRLDLIGCTSELTAVRRAQFEYMSDRMRRNTMRMHVAEEGRLLQLLDRVKVSDYLLETQAEGEGDFNGVTLTFDRDIADLSVGQTINVRSITGDFVAQTTIARVISNSQVELTFRDPALGELADAAQTRFLFSVENGRAATRDWTVVNAQPAEDGYGGWDVDCIEYKPTIYSVDNLVI